MTGDTPSDPVVRDDRIAAIGVLFSTAARLERALGKSLERECGMSHVWFEVLLRLDQAPFSTMTPTQLTEAMVLTSGGVTRLIDRMSEEGLVDRKASASDRRSTQVSLTPLGRRRLIAAAKVHARNVQTMFTDPLGPRRLTALLDALVALGPPEPNVPSAEN